MKRRQFIKLSSVLLASGALPAWSRTDLGVLRPSLPIPPLMDADIQQRFKLTARPGKLPWQDQFLKTWGYNGDYLGPALRLQQHQQYQVQIHNQLPQPTTVHWHGLVIDGDVDGGPEEVIQPGGTRTVTLQTDQPAATCWYHPHPHGNTGYQLAQGLAGMVIIEDEQVKGLPLPRRWGVDDIPLIFQDKRLTEDKTAFAYQLDLAHASAGWFGDRLLTNGVEYPQIALPQGWVRFRLLNACNARPLEISTSDQRAFYVIASDSGLLPEPVKLTHLKLLPAERFEIMVEITRDKPCDLITTPVQQMAMVLPPFDKPLPVLNLWPLAISSGNQLPDKLIPLPDLPELEGLTRRQISLAMDERLDKLGMDQLVQKYGQQALSGMAMHSMSKGHQPAMSDSPQTSPHSHHGHGTMSADMMHRQPTSDGDFDFHQGNTINGQAYKMGKIAWDVKQGSSEIWQINGSGDMMSHPFHIHGTRFRILSENGQPLPLHRQGWKDVVNVEGNISEVLVTFPKSATAQRPYMAHCHNLEHEDTGMMMSFTVTPSQ